MLSILDEIWSERWKIERMIRLYRSQCAVYKRWALPLLKFSRVIARYSEGSLIRTRKIPIPEGSLIRK